MCYKFAVAVSKLLVFSSCAVLTLTLGACGSGNSPNGPTQSGTTNVPTLPLSINGVPPATVTAGTTYSYIPSVSGVSTPGLTYGIVNKPTWASFAEASGQLSGIPAESDVGTTTGIEITATDGTYLATVGPFSIKVLPPQTQTGPTISGTPTTTVAAGSKYLFTPVASDPNGGALTFSVLNAPSWAIFSAATGQLSGTPPATDVGTYSDILISVSDGHESASLPSFSVQVTPPQTQTGPTISGTPTATVAAGSKYLFTPVASDPNGGALTFSVLNAPSWAIFSAATGQLSGTPPATDVGTYSDILISVSDGHESASLPSFSVQVTSPVTGTQAQALLNYLKGLPGKGILSGQYANYNVKGMMDQVPLISNGTGQTPAILGTFLSLGAATFNADPIALSNQWLAKGGIVLAMLSPGNPTYSATIIGGVTQSASRPNGHPVNFNNLLIPGTIEYTRWQTFLALLVADFKAINGPIIVRPFPELNSDWKWWGAQPPAQFIAVWQQLVTYVRNAGVTNVLWCLNFGATALPAGYPDLGAVVKAYYPGDAFVDVVSLDSYPPSAANDAAIAALTATGKPVIYSEMGAVKGPIPVPEFSGSTSTALTTLISNFPQIVAAVVWPGTEALPAQNGMSAFMSNPKIVNLADLPPSL